MQTQTKTQNVKRAFKRALAKNGLISPMTGQHLNSWSDDGHSALLAQWQDVAANFVWKDVRVSVEMRVEKLHFGQSWCTPVIYLAAVAVAE